MYLALERYSRPGTVEECLRSLHEPGERAALVAGGTDLNARGHESLTHVIDIQALPLDRIAVTGEWLRLGARTTLARLRRDPLLAHEGLAALREAAAAYAIVAIQNRSTVGGRVVVDRPDQDVPPALLALGARLRLARLRQGRVEEVEVDYPVGREARAVLEGALVTDVLVPLEPGRSALRRLGRTAVDVPLATCAASLRAGTVRLAANVQGPGAAGLLRLARTEALTSSWGGRPPRRWREEARASLLEELVPHEDAWASGGYRRDLSATLAVRALAAVFGQQEIDGTTGSVR